MAIRLASYLACLFSGQSGQLARLVSSWLAIWPAGYLAGQLHIRQAVHHGYTLMGILGGSYMKLNVYLVSLLAAGRLPIIF